MRKRCPIVVAIAFSLAALVCLHVEAQSTSVDLEVGYQWVDLNGSQDLYRTQINQDDGVVLRDFSVNFTDPSDEAGIVDNLRIDAAGFGGNPTGRFRLWMGKAKSYRLRLFYNKLENFNALPAFANPLLDDGITPGQHVWDRDRDIIDVELEILPNRTVTPIAGFRWNRLEGPRQTTYHVGQDEFRLASHLEETEEEYYLGLSFVTGSWSGSLIQGWRDIEAEDRLDLAPGEGDGNNSNPVLGTDVSLGEFARTVRTKADTPVTTFNVRGRLGNTVRLIASYVRADAESESSSEGMLTGSLVSFQISRFFNGLDQSISSRTEHPSWRGEARIEFDFTQALRLDVGFERRHRELEGWALISALYLDTLNFSGADPSDISTLVEARTGYERDDEIVNARLNLRDVGPFVFWAEAANNTQDLSLSEDVSQIVTPWGQQGSFERKISSFGAGTAVTLGGARVSIDIMTDKADEIIVRTDFRNRTRFRSRFDWTGPDWFRLLATAELIDLSNGRSGVGYDADTEHVALDLSFMPLDTLSFRLAYDDYSTRSRIPIRIPHDFSIVESLHREDGTLYEVSVLWRVSRFNIDVGYSSFENEGSFDLETTRSFARLGFDITNSLGAAVEIESNDYSEEVIGVADYDATRYGVFLRWRN